MWTEDNQLTFSKGCLMSRKGPNTIEVMKSLLKESWFVYLFLIAIVFFSNASGQYKEIYLDNEYVIAHRWTWWGLFWEETELQYRKVELSDYSGWHYRNSKGEWRECLVEW